MVGIDNDSNFESYEFEKTYDFSVEIRKRQIIR